MEVDPLTFFKLKYDQVAINTLNKKQDAWFNNRIIKINKDELIEYLLNSPKIWIELYVLIEEFQQYKATNGVI